MLRVYFWNMKSFLRIGLVFGLLVVLSSCYNPDKPEKEYNTAENLERAIEAIEDRKSAELRIIQEEERIIEMKEENLEAAKSDGMKNSIRQDIAAHQSSLSKARTNLANQEEVLQQLYLKLDSIRGQ